MTSTSDSSCYSLRMCSFQQVFTFYKDEWILIMTEMDSNAIGLWIIVKVRLVVDILDG